MTFLCLISAPAAAGLLSFLLTPVVRRLALRVGAVDRPGPRKVHSTEIPRMGGLAVVVSGAVVTAALWSAPLPQIDRIASDLAAGLALGLLPILACSLVDDVWPLRALPKLVVHVAGAAIAVGFGIRLGPEVHLFGETVSLGWMAVPVSLVWLVGVTSAFNIVDGLDGLSAGLAFMSAVSLAGTALFVGQSGLALVALVLAGAVAGFLPHNVHPARIFLGDTGATAIGFTLGCLALRGGSTLSSGLAILAPILVLGLPIAETIVSMARRVVRGLRTGGAMGVFEPDAGHFHHRLLALGLDARRAVLVLYGVGLTLALAGYASLFLTQQKAGVVLFTMIAAGFIALTRLRYDEFAVIRRGDLLRIYDASPILHQRPFAVFVDLALVAGSVYGAFVFKYDDWPLVRHRAPATTVLALMAPLAVAGFWAFGLYRRVWRFASVADLLHGSAAVTAVATAAAVLSVLFYADAPPLTWFATCWLLMLSGLIGTRASYRVLQEWSRRSRLDGEPVLIYGAGRGGMAVVGELLAQADHAIRPVGFIDDHDGRAGKVFNGYPVLGTLDTLPAVIARHGVKGVIVATRKLPPERVRHAALACARNGIWIRHFRVGFEEEPAWRAARRFPLARR